MNIVVNQSARLESPLTEGFQSGSVERFVTGRPRHDDLYNATARYVRAQQEDATAALVTLARFKWVFRLRGVHHRSPRILRHCYRHGRSAAGQFDHE